MRKLWIAALAAAMPCTVHASAINTYGSWDGTANEFVFGCGESTEYGQVITIPKHKSSLGQFAFWMAKFDGSGPGSMTVRGEVYQWDGLKATGNALYESKPRKIVFTDSDFHHETFRANVAVTPGAQYVVFATVDKDYAKCTSGYGLKWGAIGSDVYTKGMFVYLNDSGDTSQWTTQSWGDVGDDLTFKATVSNQ